MRVAYVCTDPGVPVFGNKGASVHIQSVLRVLVGQGAEVHLITNRAGPEAPSVLLGVHVHQLPLLSVGSAARRETEVAVSDACATGVLDALQELGRLDLVYERYSIWGRAAMAWAHANGVPSVLEVNAPLVEEQARHRTLVDRLRAERIAAEVMSLAGTVVCVSDAVSAWARSCGAPGERIRTVANGVDTGSIQPAAVAPSVSPFTVGFVGTLKPWHGVESLVRATAILNSRDSSYRLLVVGDGPEAESLRELVLDLRLEHVVEMTGGVRPQDIPALLHRMNVAVAPYPSLPDFYFSPLKIYEYFAAGLPVVATAVGDLPQALEGGRIGTLVPPDDVHALATAIEHLRAHPALRAALGSSARRAVVESHDWTHVVSRILDAAEVAHVVA